MYSSVYTYMYYHLLCFVLAPIYLINSSPRISALVGDIVTMRVSSLGLGQHALRWSRRGRNVIKGDATGVNTVQLTLPNVSIADAGRYFFTATTQWSTNRTRVELTVTCESISKADRELFYWTTTIS